MPAIAKSKAALRACAALLDAFDPECSATERRELVQNAIDAAMEATGRPSESRPDAALLCDDWELTRDATEA